LRWFELSIAPTDEWTQPSFTVILQKSNSHCRKVRRYRGLLDNLDAGVVVHAADTSVL
jgi:hypothetical protein